MKSSHYILLGFITCLAIVLGAMGWLTATALRLDRAEAESRCKAAWEENIHLALWRLDSTLAPLIAEESARPYFTYSPLLPVNRTYAEMLAERGNGEVTIQSPLLSTQSPNVVAHFQFEPDGSLTSPQAPAGRNRDVALAGSLTENAIAEAEKGLARVRAIVDRNRLLEKLPSRDSVAPVVNPPPLAQNAMQRDYNNRYRMNELANNGRGAVEYQQRTQALTVQVPQISNFAMTNVLNGIPALASTDISGVIMTPLWIDGELLFARRVMVDGRDYVQGCLLDWPVLKTSLLDMIGDLLPNADLHAVQEGEPRNEARLLAALPVRLEAGDMPSGPLSLFGSVEAGQRFSPIEMSLGAAWVCVLLAAGAVAILLVGVMRLAARRVKFVTAVTHELRTPLTTFQMYTEMLTAGIVSDDSQRKQYLETLHSEATRLTHLVENVLSYARLERGRANGRIEVVALDQLVASMEERLTSRAEQAGMELSLQSNGKPSATDNPPGETMVQANTSAVEQILFNLVDNACKYAVTASDKRIHLELAADELRGRITVRDHGPGIPRANGRTLFRSFSKSAHEAAHSAPGVGLGLALSRRLARDMGGKLHLDETNGEGGTAITLALPVAR